MIKDIIEIMLIMLVTPIITSLLGIKVLDYLDSKEREHENE